MAVFPVKLTRRGRLSSSLLSLVLISVQVICGIIFLCTGFYIFFYIGNELFSYTKNQLNNLFLFMFATSIIIFIVSATGFRCISNLSAQPTNHSTTHLHWIWLFFSFTMVLFQLFFMLILPELKEQLNVSLALTMNHGLTHYYLDESWKGMMDNLQPFHQCCGVQQYTDWYRTSWLHLSDLPQDPDLLDKYAIPNSLVMVPLVPSSCCKLPNTFCGEKSLSSNKSTTAWNEITPTDPLTIYTRGCLPVILTLLNSFLMAVQVFLIVVIILQCVIMVASRYLFTSTRNTIVMGNPYGSASGWLYGRGDLCCNWGRTLPEHDSEIFKDINVNEDKTSICKQSESGGTLNGRQNDYSEMKVIQQSVKYPPLKPFRNSKERGHYKEGEQSDSEMSDDDDRSSKCMKKLKHLLANKKIIAFLRSNKLKRVPNSDAKQTLLDQEDDESDLTDNELKSLNKDKRLSEKFQTRYMNSQRHDETLDMISLGKKNSETTPDEECSDCQEYDFDDDNAEYQTDKLNKALGDRKLLKSDMKIVQEKREYSKGNLKSETKVDHNESLNKTEHTDIHPPPPPPTGFLGETEEQDKHVLFYVDEGNFQLNGYNETDKQEQNFYLNPSESKQQNQPEMPEKYLETRGTNENKAQVWAKQPITQNYNVQTQTSQALFKTEIKDQWQNNVEQPEQTQAKESDTVVFRNYRIPLKNRMLKKDHLGK